MTHNEYVFIPVISTNVYDVQFIYSYTPILWYMFEYNFEFSQWRNWWLYIPISSDNKQNLIIILDVIYTEYGNYWISISYVLII